MFGQRSTYRPLQTSDIDEELLSHNSDVQDDAWSQGRVSNLDTFFKRMYQVIKMSYISA